MPIPIPRADESENDFIARAHRALADEFPDTDQRNAIVFKAWREAKGQGTAEKKGYQLFPADRFELVRDVPVFAEHEYTDRDGQLQRYDREALQAICDRCNYRIEDTGNFAILSQGHTPTVSELQAGAKQPEPLGFVGPYRLGMIGNKNPRWAIFADERYYRDKSDLVRRLPTRSPEVWLKDQMTERFMDPIAALGAETPRLDLGMRFAMAATGEKVEKYSAAAMPGPATGFVPTHVSSSTGKPKERYEVREGAPVSTDKEPLMLSPEDVQQIVAAVMETEPMKWVATQMQASLAPAAPPTAAPPAPAPAPESEPSPMPPAAGESKKEDKYAMLDEKARYAKLEKENAELKERVGKIEQGKREAERYSRLNDLSRTHVVDVTKELDRTKGFTDAQFVDHCVCIVENYQRIPVGASLYVPDMLPNVQTENYALRVKEESMRICEAERAKGNHGFTYEAARAQAIEKLGAAPKVA